MNDPFRAPIFRPLSRSERGRFHVKKCTEPRNRSKLPKTLEQLPELVQECIKQVASPVIGIAALREPLINDRPVWMRHP
jgi:hypothetical protein